jgi:hypothetical protein
MRRAHLVFFLVLLSATSASALAAQGGMGGMGGGGMGGGRRGGGRRGGGEDGGPRGDARANPLGDEMARRFEGMAALKPVLDDVKVPRNVRDSLDTIEKTYGAYFAGYAKWAREQFAKQARPDTAELRKIVKDARTLRDEEHTLVKSLLPADQAKKVDDNITKIIVEETRRDVELQRRQERIETNAATPGGMPTRPPQR